MKMARMNGRRLWTFMDRIKGRYLRGCFILFGRLSVSLIPSTTDMASTEHVHNPPEIEVATTTSFA